MSERPGEPATQQNQFNILCLSGGGYLGLFTAYILAQIEERIGAPLGRRFDLVAGTSIGGIIALAIANEVPLADVVRAFETRGHEIFSSRDAARGFWRQAADLSRMLFSPKHHQEALKRVVHDLLGDRVLGDAVHRVMIPALNLTKGQPQVFKTPHLPKYERDWRQNAVDVALATSAAPTFFRLAEVRAELFADGGLFANSPDFLALHEAEHFLGVPRQAVRVLSVGTTTASYAISLRVGRELGALKWLMGNRLVSSLLASQQQMVHMMMAHLLADRYVRVDVTPSKDQEADLGLDVAGPIARRTILAIAEGAAREAMGNPKVMGMLDHHPSTPEFFHGARKEQ